MDVRTVAENNRVIIKMTDDEALELLEALAYAFTRRKRLIEEEPSMKNWNDAVSVKAGTVNGTGGIVAFSIGA